MGNSVETQQARASSYRPDIDGLRAIAVLGVVFYHAGLGVPGGLAGVDVFFVISGFLITRLILRELDEGTFSFRDFWERRVRRILPALVVVVATVLVFGWFFSLPYHYLVIGQSAVALVALSSNIQFWRTTGYFQPEAEENPLLHTWSLSVEEQFYLFVPLLLWLLYKIRREKWVISTLVAGTALSLAASVIWLERSPEGAFYLLPSRAWELGAGCLLAKASPIRNAALRSVAATSGFGMILVVFFAYGNGIAFPGLAAVPPVLGTALVIWSGIGVHSRIDLPLVGRVLSLKPLVFVGLTSYSFYLWHWPFFAFHRYYTSSGPDLPIALAIILASFALSVLSLQFVERPFRTPRKQRGRSRALVWGGGAMATILIASFSIYHHHGVPSRVPDKVVEIDSEGFSAWKNKRPFEISDGSKLELLGADGEKPRVLLWGDSHALSLLSVFDEVSRDFGVTAIGSATPGIPPVLGWATDGIIEMKGGEHNRAVLEYVKSAEGAALEHVVLAFFWSAYHVDQVTPPPFGKPEPGFDDALVKTIGELESLGIEVSLFREVPVFHVHVPRAASLAEWHDAAKINFSADDDLVYRSVYAGSLEKIRKLKPETNLIPTRQYFLGQAGDIDYIDPDGRLLYRDTNHLAHRGALRLLPEIEPIFERLLSERNKRILSAEHVE